MKSIAKIVLFVVTLASALPLNKTEEGQPKIKAETEGSIFESQIFWFFVVLFVIICALASELYCWLNGKRQTPYYLPRHGIPPRFI
ncbi:unnamed protein product [Caenorhabditis angaria]|uniref:Uncharacterized protein n=1 Tax=Caenorhabditis angaria TaxID=860376 RepID=A0A9P1IWM0_9PELO|nr:unnamed protein product [Caenorhabditis angaria]